MKVKKICIMALVIVLISSFATSCFAVTESTTTAPTTSETTKVEITKEKLNEKFQELKEYISFNNGGDKKLKAENIVVNDNTIEISTEKDKYEINYEIQDNKVIFSSETEIKQGMSWKEYNNATNSISDIFFGFIAVANIIGIEYEDSSLYVGFLQMGMGMQLSGNCSYVVLTPEEANQSQNIEGQETILSTEFENRTMEYFNSYYKDDKYTYGGDDDDDNLTPVEVILEKKDKEENSCKLVETLNVNLNSDFSEIKGISNGLSGGVTKENADYVYTLKVGQKIKFETSQKYSGYSCVGTGIELSEDKNELIATEVGTAKGNITFGNITKSFYITVEENTNNEQLEDIIIKIESEESKTEDTKSPTTETTSKTTTTTTGKTENIKNNTDSTTSKTELPKTGINTMIYITMAIVGTAVVTFIILNKKYKDIK